MLSQNVIDRIYSPTNSTAGGPVTTLNKQQSSMLSISDPNASKRPSSSKPFRRDTFFFGQGGAKNLLQKNLLKDRSTFLQERKQAVEAISYPPPKKQFKHFGILGLTDTQTDSFEFEEQLRQLREQRETGGTKKRKDNSFHAFGLGDALFTSKGEQAKNERNFRQMCKQIDEGIVERERKMVELQHQQSIRKSISLMTQDQKRNLTLKLQTMDDQEKSASTLFQTTKRSAAGAFTRKSSLSKRNTSPVDLNGGRQSVKVS